MEHVEHRKFVQTVAERADLSREAAADLVRATVETLGDRLSAGEARHLASCLPEFLRGSFPIRDRSRPFGLHDFVMRISRRTGLTPKEATDGVRAVLTTLRQTVPGDVFDQAMSQLPAEYQEMAAPAA
ncbi:hypothetical protein GCM10017673_45500 [Streptosporangium violaceochromogenes]|nr:hypothetical protein GCM10017673_45500 [Streptosporangium violaceochromogenes]